MPRDLPTPITCLITPGATSSATTPSSPEFDRLLALVRAAVAAGCTLVQLREKNLTARTLYELSARSAELARGSGTLILVNDRADIARAAACDGVQLTTLSLETSVVRRAFGPGLLLGVSTHSTAEAARARDAGADFVVLGPVFDTPSKRAYGPPLGLETLTAAARSLAPLPVVAVGGVNLGNAREVFRAGARGLAAIRLFNDPPRLADTVRAIENQYGEVVSDE